MLFSNVKIPVSYHLIDTYKKVAWLRHVLSRTKEFSFDIETNHPTTKSKPARAEWYDAKSQHIIVGISFAWGRTKFEQDWKPGQAAYLPLANIDETPFWGARQEAVVQAVRDIQALNAVKVAQNGKFDVKQLLLLLKIETTNFEFDTMLAHSLIDEENLVSTHALKSKFNAQGSIISLGMSDAYLSLGSSSFKQDLDDALAYYDPRFKRYSRVPLDVLWPYGCADSDLTLALRYAFEPMLEVEGLTWDFYNVVMPLQRRLMFMEMKGVPLDIERAQSVVREQGALVSQYAAKIHHIFGREFNVSSPAQLGKIFFEELKLPGGRRNKQGWIVDSEVLENMDHPAASLILKYRRADHLCNTFAAASLKHAREISEDGKLGWVHTDYYMPSKTGRIKAKEPNLSQMPRKENGGEIAKGLYNCPDGYRFVFMDESQVELRVIAHLSGEPVWIDGFNAGQDMHAAMAVKAFKLPCTVDEVKTLYPEKRSDAKTVNFGIAYGRTVANLAEQLGISVEDADTLIHRDYFGGAPRLKEWIDETHAFVKQYGYIPTLFGRRRHLPDGMLTPVKSMAWPADAVRPKCYRDGPYLAELGIELKDIYDMSVFKVRDQIRSLSNGRHKKCLGCPYITSCLVNRERKFVQSKINAAMRQAVNSPVQGTAVEMVSLCAVWIGDEFEREGMDAELVLHIHDELGAIVRADQVEKASKIMNYYMTTYLREYTNFSVPLIADAEVCQRWSDKGKAA